MRLIKLKLRNIASLKGEHLIDFDAITNSSPLFAITGETGSGKSSILNAIAMSLYGRVYKSSLNQTDIVTLGERDAQIQLIFSIKGEYYLADWKGKIRKQNGELLKTPSTDRVIQKIEGPSFEARRSTEVYQSEDLLNLNFDQFCKCIILNQGEFAKFLTSSFTDRKAILEKLYPGSEIENVSRFLKLELDTATAKMSIITTQLDTLSIAPEQGEILTREKNEVTKNIAIKSAYQKRYSNFKRSFENLEVYYQYFQDNTQRQLKLQLEIKDLTAQFNTALSSTEIKLKELEIIGLEVETRTPTLQDLIKKEEQVKHLNIQIQDLQTKLESSKLLKERNIDQAQQISIKKDQWQVLHQRTLDSFNFNPESLLSLRNELENFVDNSSKIEKLNIEQKNLKTKLSEVEIRGQELKLEIASLEKNMTMSPSELKTELDKYKEKKNEAQNFINTRDVEKKTKDLNHKRLISLAEELQKLSLERVEVQNLLKNQNSTLKALELSLNVYEYQIGLKKCITHSKIHKPSQCPICETSTNDLFWENLSVDFKDTDVEEMASSHEKIAIIINDLKNKENLISSKTEQAQRNSSELELEINAIDKRLSDPIPEMKLIESQIEEIEKKLIHFEHQQKEMNRLNLEITHVRTLYLQTKDALAKIEEELRPIISENDSLAPKLKLIDPSFQTKLSELKTDLRLLVGLTQERKQGEAFEQNLIHLKENLETVLSNINTMTKELSGLQVHHKNLTNELIEKLQGSSAQKELSHLQERFKEASALVQAAQTQQKSFEQALSLKRGTISTIDQLLKDYELQFIETCSEIKGIALDPIIALGEQISSFEQKLKNLTLSLKDSIDLIVASKEMVQGTLSEFELSLVELNNQLGVINEKISHWDKTQDKVKLLKLEFEESNSKLERFKRLSSILGTDELRTFALSLVEENLIIQTNEELNNLCQSRYEITHRSRRGITPEFYILDKFREGEERKVSTLSGGETFMVSLAMALALAEMTRGQAEIDTLFIDEGFGTLDHESLEDVLDMLNQIQNRGLMIGIISHIKTLTNALGVNLALNKAQDGTSKVSIQFN